MDMGEPMDGVPRDMDGPIIAGDVLGWADDGPTRVKHAAYGWPMPNVTVDIAGLR